MDILYTIYPLSRSHHGFSTNPPIPSSCPRSFWMTHLQKIDERMNAAWKVGFCSEQVGNALGIHDTKSEEAFGSNILLGSKWDRSLSENTLVNMWNIFFIVNLWKKSHSNKSVRLKEKDLRNDFITLCIWPNFLDTFFLVQQNVCTTS